MAWSQCIIGICFNQEPVIRLFGPTCLFLYLSLFEQNFPSYSLITIIWVEPFVGHLLHAGAPLFSIPTTASPFF